MPTWDVEKTHWQVAEAWRGAQKPDAIIEAIRVGEQVIDLLTQATALVERACQDTETLIDNAHLYCQPILDRLTSETDRVKPVLSRLRAASSKGAGA